MSPYKFESNVLFQGDLVIRMMIEAEDRMERTYWYNNAKIKLAKLCVRDLAALATKLKVYERATEVLGKYNIFDASREQVKAVLIDSILTVDNYVAALADDAEDDYAFP